jgi:hypothetical protein
MALQNWPNEKKKPELPVSNKTDAMFALFSLKCKYLEIY